MTGWNVLRAAGIGSYAMLFLSVAWGLVSTTTPFGKRVSKPSATLAHQYLATCGLFLLAIHLGGLLVDGFFPFGPREILVPMASTYRPVAVALGVVAMYASVAVVVTSWLRSKIGTAWWRRMHLLAIPTFVLSLLHGLLAGTDGARPAMWWTYVVTGLVIVFLVVVRALTVGLRPERRTLPEGVRRAPAPARAPQGVPAGD